MSENVPSYDIDATVGVGINLTQDLAFSEAVNNAANAGLGDAGNPGGGISFLNTPTRLAAFGVYYDIGAKKLAMVAPQVTGPNGDIACEAPAGIADGTYYCNVKLDTSSGEYTAVIETKAAEEESGKQTVASVKLFTLDGEKFTQHHTGAVVVSAGATTDEGMPMFGDVRWAPLADDGAGAWMMWLGGGILLRVNEKEVPYATVRAGLSYVGSPYIQGWMSMKEIIAAYGGDLWMRVLIPTSDTGSVSVEWASEPGEASEGYVLRAIPIARCWRHSSTGEVRVWQWTHGLVNIYTVTAVKVKGGDDSNIVGTGVIGDNGVLTVTLDAYYV